MQFQCFEGCWGNRLCFSNLMFPVFFSREWISCEMNSVALVMNTNASTFFTSSSLMIFFFFLLDCLRAQCIQSLLVQLLCYMLERIFFLNLSCNCTFGIFHNVEKTHKKAPVINALILVTIISCISKAWSVRYACTRRHLSLLAWELALSCILTQSCIHCLVAIITQ